MLSAAIALVAFAFAAVILLSTVQVGFVVLMGSTLLVPGGVGVLTSFLRYSTFTRVELVAMLIRLMIGVRRHELARSAFRWTLVHTAFSVFLICSYLSGIALAAGGTTQLSSAGKSIALLEELVFFVVMLACIRAIADLRWVLTAMTA